MSLGQELREAIRKHRPGVVCLGGVCYFRLNRSTLTKVNLTSRGGNYDGLQLTILNQKNGPVDTVTIHGWDVPHRTKAVSDDEENAGWDIYRPVLDIDALWNSMEEYLRLFQEFGQK